ncbi:hypothetical protein C5O19_03285 [Siphonobacter curvatus]|uniref:Uncharacterized protein n=1 Tax=Siphonobacter curvatus TaxID=2094562 RepID=A0A2S7ILT5_9BACT|nr:hypothetical protein C5O19_03285 [Siphonobacter curvatus]
MVSVKTTGFFRHTWGVTDYIRYLRKVGNRFLNDDGRIQQKHSSLDYSSKGGAKVFLPVKKNITRMLTQIIKLLKNDDVTGHLLRI